LNALLDVNLLVAWGWADHEHHAFVTDWLSEFSSKKSNRIFNSAIPQLGFVRVSIHRGGGSITPESAGKVLGSMIQSLGKKHLFVADDLASDHVWPVWCRGAGKTTDAHLVELARRHHAVLATLDRDIQGEGVHLLAP